MGALFKSEYIKGIVNYDLIYDNYSIRKKRWKNSEKILRMWIVLSEKF